LMIEDFVCDVRRNSQSGHPGHTGLSQVMKAPLSYSGELIQ
jgi:hypothetical protein